jgi:hypothetical protein
MYEELDPEEPRRIQVLNADGSLFNTLWADMNFCRDILIYQPENVFPAGGSWRPENYVPPDPPDMGE